MSDTSQKEADSPEINAGRPGRRLKRPLSVRVSPGNYFSAAFATTFLSAFAFYLERDIFGTALFFIALVLIPILAFTDRVSFDGRRLRRTGLLPGLWSYLNRSRIRLKLTDIEQVDTQSLRTIRRGGSLRYRYATSFRGNGTIITIVSGGAAYRRMIAAILPGLNPDVLDGRSAELCDHLLEPRKVRQLARLSQIPPVEVLESSVPLKRSRRRSDDPASVPPPPDRDVCRAQDLRSVGNKLRVSGSLLQAIEAFRRAVLLSPGDGWLLLEFARCLMAFAGAERDEKAQRRSVAMLRLAEKRAVGDRELLSRIGESYFQVGDWKRAASVFKRTLAEFGDSFRALRGLAEIALREGKIAHVIHNFAAANRSAATASLRRWTKGEVEYFSRLNEDNEYMELEVSRVNLLDTLFRARRTTFRIIFLGIPLILTGRLLENSLASNLGWGVSIVSLALWMIVSIGERALERRIPFELVDTER